MDELGIHSDINNKASAYEEQQYSPDAVTENHARSMTKFNIKLTEKKLKLPQIYWIPKLHKTRAMGWLYRAGYGSSFLSTVFRGSESGELWVFELNYFRLWVLGVGYF